MASRLWHGIPFMALALAVSTPGLAQGTDSTTTAQWKIKEANWTTRDSLTARLSRKGPDSAMAAERLRDGDFHAGDRVLLTVEGEQALTDTFVVRQGVNDNPVLLLPNIDKPVSLHGVLRSELEPRLDTVIGEYIKNPVVHAEALLLVMVSGSVKNPGSYTVPADEQIGSVLARAGGLSSSANPNDITVKRSNAVIYNKKAMQQAVVERTTLDELGFQAADEIYVSDRPPNRLLTFLGIGGSIIGIAASVIIITGR